MRLWNPPGQRFFLEIPEQGKVLVRLLTDPTSLTKESDYGTEPADAVECQVRLYGRVGCRMIDTFTLPLNCIASCASILGPGSFSHLWCPFLGIGEIKIHKITPAMQFPSSVAYRSPWSTQAEGRLESVGSVIHVSSSILCALGTWTPASHVDWERSNPGRSWVSGFRSS